ncbi:hypothetical protein [Aquimarina mytili]|uniref:Uncharacterized protein n=1 Tax=Aquimarina mytili TaxID=874423 RepID=A0A936ZW76_9FLAO|nr:hypothetical protein [Aquimarina mytili]MBL0683115.1 hypothetical protein [Aquimarina mytili]
MRKNNVFAVLFLVITGMYAQQEDQFSTPITESNLTEEKEIQYSTSVNMSPTYDVKYSIQKYEEMIQRSKELTSKLVEYDKLIKSGSMKRKQEKNWKRDVMEAKLLNFRIEDFNKVYRSGNYPMVNYLSIQALNNYDDFAKTLEDAVQYAGF